MPPKKNKKQAQKSEEKKDEESVQDPTTQEPVVEQTQPSVQTAPIEVEPIVEQKQPEPLKAQEVVPAQIEQKTVDNTQASQQVPEQKEETKQQTHQQQSLEANGSGKSPSTQEREPQKSVEQKSTPFQNDTQIQQQSPQQIVEEQKIPKQEPIKKQPEQKQPVKEEKKQKPQEEVKVDKAKLQRKDSKFKMQKDEKESQLFRPEFKYDVSKKGNEKLWELMSSYIGADEKSIQRSIVNHVEYTLGLTRFNFDNFGAYQASSYSIRDRLIESLNDTNQYFTTQDVKRVYYLSLEFLLGRLMQNALVNIDMEEQYKKSLLDLGYKLEDLYEEEVDPALGNGGLGRLAACFLDSLATNNIPAWGYGIRYDYGIFKQKIVDGAQVEVPDFWLSRGNPWEIERADVTYPIRFYGNVRKYKDGPIERAVWEGGEIVIAMAYDTPIPGFNTFNTNNLRLWKSKPANEFDFKSFNAGNYHGAIKERQRAEYITSVLYPNDSTYEGKELRLKQQYFFCSATIRDIIRRYKKLHTTWDQFYEKNQIQLNDTHPAISTIELLRILIDEEKLPWEQAWNIVYRTFAYTNHTVLPEALEKWSIELFGKLLPRHLDLIYLINHLFLEKVRAKYPGDNAKIMRMSLIEEGDEKKVRMANLSIISAHSVNGVAAIHTQILKDSLFKEFHQLWPEKINNKTNGVTPRRWIHCCNPDLSKIISEKIGSLDEWLSNLQSLTELNAWSTDKDFQTQFQQVKRANKERLQKWVKINTGIDIPVDAMYDVMVKRIHEYKRQLMNAFYIIHRYLSIKDTPADQRKENFVPRVVMIGGKAAPGYYNAKAIIKLINSVANKINNDPDIGDLLKVVFLPNYCVSAAQIIIPGADLSQHISTAGTEASGTSNMKFVMNGSLIIGTMDGANVEIAEEIGANNMFIFGANLQEAAQFKEQLRNGRKDYIGSRLKRVFDSIRNGQFGDLRLAHGILDQLEHGQDSYIVCFDFYPYVEAQNRVDATYRDIAKWTQMSIEGIAYSGKFSSDRTIDEYCKEIWSVEPVQIPKPTDDPNARVRSFANLADTGAEITEERQ